MSFDFSLIIFRDDNNSTSANFLAKIPLLYLIYVEIDQNSPSLQSRKDPSAAIPKDCDIRIHINLQTV